MAPMPDQQREKYPVRKSFFDVVLISNQAAEHTAEMSAFKRIEAVEAVTTMDALDDERVKAAMAEGYHLIQVVNPGFQTAAEREAHARQHQIADRADAERRRKLAEEGGGRARR